VCYTGSGMSLITVWMCVVWPRVQTLKDCNYQIRNLDSCCRWRCMLCPCKVRNTFFIHFWYRTILLCMPSTSRTDKPLTVFIMTKPIQCTHFLVWLRSILILYSLKHFSFFLIPATSPHIWSTLISSPVKHLVNTSHKAPRYVVFSTLLLPRPS
jgi:hypothetical protein